MTTILSDIHLGYPASLVKRAEQLEPLLSLNPSVIFNGDTFEQRFEKEELGFIASKADMDELLHSKPEITPLFLTGNHDPNISQSHFHYTTEGVFITHGDIVDPTLLFASKYHNDNNGCNQTHPTELRNSMCTKASKPDNRAYCSIFNNAERINYFLRNTLKPSRLLSTIKLWRTFHPTLYSKFSEYNKHLQASEDKQFLPKVFITGHIHRPGIHIGDSFISINTGSFIPLMGRYLVEIDDQIITVRSIDYYKRKFFPGKKISQIDLSTISFR